MDEQVVAGSETQADIAAFVARYPFPIDDFQLEAIAHLAADRSVMVAAQPDGKPLVAEYAIWRRSSADSVLFTRPPLRLSPIRNIGIYAPSMDSML